MSVSVPVLRRLAWAVFAVCGVIGVASMPLDLMAPARATSEGAWGGTSVVSSVLFGVVIFTFPLVGLLIAHRQPGNPIAWILLAIGLVWFLGLAADSYALYGLVIDPGSVPGAGVVAAVNEAAWVPGIGLMGTYLILLFPDGRLPTRRWRPVAWLSGITMLVASIAIIFLPGTLEESPVPTMQNPIAIESLATLMAALTFTLVLFAVCLAVCAVGLILRFRRSRGVERLQMKWLATAGAFVAVTFLIAMVASLATPDDTARSSLMWIVVLQAVSVLSFGLIPLAIGVAVLKHGLYGIDVVINKAVVFGSLGAFITGVYVAIVVGVGTLVGQGNDSLVLSIAATAVVAIGFQPVRERVQHVANRVVYGSRATPYEVLSDFASRMGGTYGSADLLPRMARTVGEGMGGAARVEVWLKIGGRLIPEAAWPLGAETADPIEIAGDELPALGGDRVVPVRHHGELLGVLTVSKKAGEPVTPTEDRLLADVASQAGLVLRNVRLIEDLRSSRERLVRTQDTERRRLERNLHDGAQQSLVSVALLLRMARARVSAEQTATAEAIDEASRQMTAAIEELRELARGLHPAILTERGLRPAITSIAERARLPVTLDIAVADRLPDTIEGTVYFVVSEALTNIAKYAHATSAAVTIEQADGTLTTTVTDDGIGGADPRKGSGLSGLADRVAAVDGQFDVHSPQGGGTRVTCRIPVHQHHQPAPEDGAVSFVAAFAAGGSK